MATDSTNDATRRLNVKKQTLDDAYAAPANFLEIDVVNPVTHGVGKKRYTDYEVRMRVSNSNLVKRICLNNSLCNRIRDGLVIFL